MAARWTIESSCSCSAFSAVRSEGGADARVCERGAEVGKLGLRGPLVVGHETGRQRQLGPDRDRRCEARGWPSNHRGDWMTSSETAGNTGLRSRGPLRTTSRSAVGLHRYLRRARLQGPRGGGRLCAASRYAGQENARLRSATAHNRTQHIEAELRDDPVLADDEQADVFGAQSASVLPSLLGRSPPVRRCPDGTERRPAAWCRSAGFCSRPRIRLSDMSDSRYSVAGQVDLARPRRRLCTADLAVPQIVSPVVATAFWLPILFGAGLCLKPRLALIEW